MILRVEYEFDDEPGKVHAVAVQGPLADTPEKAEAHVAAHIHRERLDGAEDAEGNAILAKAVKCKCTGPITPAQAGPMPVQLQKMLKPEGK